MMRIAGLTILVISCMRGRPELMMEISAEAALP